MGLFNWLFGKNEEPKNEPVKAVGNILQFTSVSQAEAMFSRARCENGEVYCCGTNEFKIGSYETDPDGKTIVWDVDHNLKIGLIPADNRSIYLTLGDLWVQVRKNLHNIPMPPSLDNM